MRISCWVQAFIMLVALVGVARAAPAGDVLFYLPFDGSAEAKAAGGEPKVKVEGAPAFVDGVAGKAVEVGGKDRLVYSAVGNFDIRQGTYTLWASPQDWTAGVDTFQFLVSFLNAQYNVDYLLYKICDSPVLTFLSRNADPVQRVLSKGVLSWRIKEWHQVAITWDEKVYRLFVDGQMVAEQSVIAMPREGWQQIVVGTAYPSWGRLGERVYSAVPYMDRRLLRNLAQFAGVHLYCAPGPVVMAHGSFVLIHKGYDSPAKLSVTLPPGGPAGKVEELYSQREVATKDGKLELEGAGSRTYFLRLPK